MKILLLLLFAFIVKSCDISHPLFVTVIARDPYNDSINMSRQSVSFNKKILYFSKTPLQSCYFLHSEVLVRSNPRVKAYHILDTRSNRLNLIYSIKGTSNINDVFADMKFMFNKPPANYLKKAINSIYYHKQKYSNIYRRNQVNFFPQALRNYRQSRNSGYNPNISIFGHSLGAILCQMTGFYFNLPCYAVESFGLANIQANFIKLLNKFARRNMFSSQSLKKYMSTKTFEYFGMVTSFNNTIRRHDSHKTIVKLDQGTKCNIFERILNGLNRFLRMSLNPKFIARNHKITSFLKPFFDFYSSKRGEKPQFFHTRRLSANEIVNSRMYANFRTVAVRCSSEKNRAARKFQNSLVTYDKMYSNTSRNNLNRVLNLTKKVFLNKNIKNSIRKGANKVKKEVKGFFKKANNLFGRRKWFG